jgi:hypothetical protein
MSDEPSTSTSNSNFASIFNAALETYRRKMKKHLASHPLLPVLQSCDSPEAVITVLREQIPAFCQSQNDDDGITNWVTPTVKVLYSFSDTLGQGVGLVNIKMFPREEFLLNIYFQAFPPANAIFVGIGILLSVHILHVFPPQLILTHMAHRRLTISVLARTNSTNSLTALNVSSADSRFTLRSH